MKKIIVLLNHLLLVFLCMHQAHAAWHMEEVDSPRNFGAVDGRSMAISPDGTVHVAYGGDHLYHASYEGNAWHYETVDPSPRTGGFTSLAIGSLGKVHILYSGIHVLYDGYYPFLKYASNVSGVWVIEAVDNISNDEFSFALDSNDKLHICFNGFGDSALQYATNASGSWIIETVDGQGGHYISLALDSSDKVHISYNSCDSLMMKHATNASGIWTTEVVDNLEHYGGLTSLAVDASDKVHICYSDLNLKYATNSSGMWTTEVVDYNFVYDPSLILDANNKAHISYFDSTAYDLKYTTNASGTWSTMKVQSSRWVRFSGGLTSSIALADSERVRITYKDYDCDLKYAWCDGECENTSNWHIEGIDESGDVGMYNSLALDSSDKAHISYGGIECNGYDYGYNYGYALKYATNTSGSWILDTIDQGEGRGEYTSLALDPNDKAHISSLGGYFTNATGLWVKETPGIKMFTSLAVDASNGVHISYYDDSGEDLKYTTIVSGEWVTVTVDDLGDAGADSSLALDSYGKVHISYWAAPDELHSGLKYATNQSGTWETEMVVAGSYPSLAIDTNDKAHISFCDYTDSTLKYATNVSGNWVVETVDSIGEGYASLALDSSDKVHISYFKNNNLTYATNASGTWLTETIDGSGCSGSFTSIALDSHDKIHISYDDCNYDLKYIRQCPETDVDCDEISNGEDNCPNEYNPNQEDSNGNGRGDVCDGTVSTSTVSATTTTTAFTTTSVSSSTTTSNPVTSTTTTSSFCPCIAVSLYGEDAPETERIRHFRDSVLSRTEEGKALINLYYQWSSAVVKAMQEDQGFKDEVRAMMDLTLPMIGETLN